MIINNEIVSVIIPVYIVEKYLDECVQSVINQTYRDLEIILVDDGSPDNCPSMCDEYAAQDSRIVVVHKQNGGLSSARNAGIDVARGEYLLFVDSDDYISPVMVEELLNAITASHAEIAASRISSDAKLICTERGQSTEVLQPKQVMQYILTEKVVTTSASGKLYRRDTFGDTRYPEGKIYEDLGTTYKLINKCQRIVFVDGCFYYYRSNPESITQASFSLKHLDYYEIAAELKKFIAANYPEFTHLADYHRVRISISFMRKISRSGFDDQQTIRFLTKQIRGGIFRYFFSGYSIFSKLYGIAIAVSPQIALSFFRKH